MAKFPLPCMSYALTAFLRLKSDFESEEVESCVLKRVMYGGNCGLVVCHESVGKFLEVCFAKNFCEQVCDVIGRLDVDQFDDVCLDGFTYKMVAYGDVL